MYKGSAIAMIAIATMQRAIVLLSKIFMIDLCYINVIEIESNSDHDLNVDEYVNDDDEDDDMLLLTTTMTTTTPVTIRMTSSKTMMMMIMMNTSSL